MKRLLINVIFILTSYLASGQSISSLGTGEIVELECEQSNVSGTFVTASMERDDNFRTRVLIHRSTDDGVSWSLIDSIVPNSTDSEIPDPVLASDDVGNFYLVVMRVNRNTDLPKTTVDLELYRSYDDGVTWSYAGSPHLSDSLADYPQIIACEDKELYLTYTYIVGFPSVEKTVLKFKKSLDGGNTWTGESRIDEEVLNSIGSDIFWISGDSLMISSGDRDSNMVHCYSSTDFGNTWSHEQTSSIPGLEKAHITKPVSNELYNFYGIISHKPHKENSPVIYHAISESGTHTSMLIDSGSYSQGIITDDGEIHIIYNKKEGNDFKILYTKSVDKGITFSSPLTLYRASFSNSGSGEYQSLIYGDDDLFYLSFCDWSDNSSAKMLVFSPSSISGRAEGLKSNIDFYPNPTDGTFHINSQDHYRLLRVRLLNMRGEVVYSSRSMNSSPKVKLDVSHLKSGFYIITLETENKIFVDRIIKSQ